MYWKQVRSAGSGVGVAFSLTCVRLPAMAPLRRKFLTTQATCQRAVSSVVKVVLWSRGGGSPNEARLEQTHWGSLLGLKWEQGGWAPSSPPHFNHWVSSCTDESWQVKRYTAERPGLHVRCRAASPGVWQKGEGSETSAAQRALQLGQTEAGYFYSSFIYNSRYTHQWSGRMALSLRRSLESVAYGKRQTMHLGHNVPQFE